MAAEAVGDADDERRSGRPALKCNRLQQANSAMAGGWGGIRTHGGREPTPVFKTGALNHSATHPTQRSKYLGYDPIANESGTAARLMGGLVTKRQYLFQAVTNCPKVERLRLF